ncbi:MAG: NGG1p interacting factor NIF3 [Pseudomonadales bacterium]|nr:NGG1p interacting factor NIF3 [Pseudomonadales bacterium]
MYKLCFYVPVEQAEHVKAAVFATGAGTMGNYEACCWQVEGRGQFKPRSGAKPAIGAVDQLEIVEELKIELVCTDEQVKPAVVALIAAHPYEEPAYQIWPVLSLSDLDHL